jgi:hypothetical protein
MKRLLLCTCCYAPRHVQRGKQAVRQAADKIAVKPPYCGVPESTMWPLIARTSSGTMAEKGALKGGRLLSASCTIGKVKWRLKKQAWHHCNAKHYSLSMAVCRKKHSTAQHGHGTRSTTQQHDCRTSARKVGGSASCRNSSVALAWLDTSTGARLSRDTATCTTQHTTTQQAQSVHTSSLAPLHSPNFVSTIASRQSFRHECARTSWHVDTCVCIPAQLRWWLPAEGRDTWLCYSLEPLGPPQSGNRSDLHTLSTQRQGEAGLSETGSLLAV